MKKNSVGRILIFFLSLFLISCVSVREYDAVDSSLNDEEGWLVLRIINPTAGKTFFFANERSGEPLKGHDDNIPLNSDLRICTLPFSDKPYDIKNTEAPVQLVMLRIKRGLYLMSQVGKSSFFSKLKSFSVVSGKINYLGDYYISVIDGTFIRITTQMNDWYTLRIEDNFDDLMDSFRKYGYFDEGGAFAGLEAINICTPTNGTLRPDNCPVR